MSLLGASQEVTEEGRQRVYYPLETRSAKTVPLSLHSFFRESRHLQLLRLQVKETCKHGSGTRRAFVKTFRLRFPHPISAKAFAFTTCRSWWLRGERWCKTEFYTSSSFDARTASRRAVNYMPILCLAAKNRRRKGTKGQAP